MHGKKGFKQVLERFDSVLAFSKTNFYLEQGKFELKLGKRACGTAFLKKCRIIRYKSKLLSLF